MKGLTFQGTRDVRVEDVPDAVIEEPTDAIVRVSLAGICGSDLHILNAGEAFGFPAGSRLGHEFIGTVEAVGADVRGFAPGDRVLSSCSVACGECTWCREGLAVLVRAVVAVRLGAAHLAARRRRAGRPVRVRARPAGRHHPARHARGAGRRRPRHQPPAAGRHDVHRVARPHLRRGRPGAVRGGDRRRGRGSRLGPRRHRQGRRAHHLPGPPRGPARHRDGCWAPP